MSVRRTATKDRGRPAVELARLLEEGVGLRHEDMAEREGREAHMSEHVRPGCRGARPATSVDMSRKKTHSLGARTLVERVEDDRLRIKGLRGSRCSQREESQRRQSGARSGPGVKVGAGCRGRGRAERKREDQERVKLAGR